MRDPSRRNWTERTGAWTICDEQYWTIAVLNGRWCEPDRDGRTGRTGLVEAPGFAAFDGRFVRTNGGGPVRNGHGRRDAPEQAERDYRRALAIKEELLGQDHPDVAMTLNNLGVLVKTLGRREEAEALYERALAIFERTLDRDHSRLLLCRRNLEKLRRGK